MVRLRVASSESERSGRHVKQTRDRKHMNPDARTHAVLGQGWQANAGSEVAYAQSGLTLSRLGVRQLQISAKGRTRSHSGGGFGTVWPCQHSLAALSNCWPLFRIRCMTCSRDARMAENLLPSAKPLDNYSNLTADFTDAPWADSCPLAWAQFATDLHKQPQVHAPTSDPPSTSSRLYGL